MSRSTMKRVITDRDVDVVKNLIERCVQLYMSPKEILKALLEKANIEPEFTEIVWQKLKEENPEFFRAYYTRLALKQQIEQFNTLLAKQKELMDLEQIKATSFPTSTGFQYHAVPSPPNFNGSHIHSISENSTSYHVDVQTLEGLNLKNILHGVDSSLSNTFNNGGSSFGIVDKSFHGDISSVSYNTENTNMSLQQGIGWGANISKPEYSSSSPLMFGANGKIAEVNPNIRDAIQHSVGSSLSNAFNNVGSSSGTVDMSFHGNISSVPYNTQNTNMSLQQGVSRTAHISKFGYSSSSPVMFGVDRKVAEVNPNIGDDIQHGVCSSLSKAFNSGGSSSGTIHVPFSGDISSGSYNTQNTNMSLQQGIGWGANISKHGYSSSSPLMFGADGKVAEVNPNIRDASVTSIANIEPNSRSMNGAILDHTKTYSSEPLSRNFSFPEESSLASLFFGSSSSPSFTSVLDDYPRPPPF